jgi:hypothetical protein
VTVRIGLAGWLAGWLERRGKRCIASHCHTLLRDFSAQDVQPPRASTAYSKKPTISRQRGRADGIHPAPATLTGACARNRTNPNPRPTMPSPPGWEGATPSTPAALTRPHSGHEITDSGERALCYAIALAVSYALCHPDRKGTLAAPMLRRRIHSQFERLSLESRIVGSTAIHLSYDGQAHQDRLSNCRERGRPGSRGGQVPPVNGRRKTRSRPCR